MLPRLLAILGMTLTAAGTVMLWRSSPAGYALSGYGSPAVLDAVAKNNRRMSRTQKLAVASIIIGTGLQVPLVVLS